MASQWAQVFLNYQITNFSCMQGDFQLQVYVTDTDNVSDFEVIEDIVINRELPLDANQTVIVNGKNQIFLIASFQVRCVPPQMDCLGERDTSLIAV